MNEITQAGQWLRRGYRIASRHAREALHAIGQYDAAGHVDTVLSKGEDGLRYLEGPPTVSLDLPLDEGLALFSFLWDWLCQSDSMVGVTFEDRCRMGDAQTMLAIALRDAERHLSADSAQGGVDG